MQRIISRAVVAVLAAFAILTPTGYAMTDQGATVPVAKEMHDAQLQFVHPHVQRQSSDDAEQVLASRGQGAPVAKEKHDAQLDKVLGPPVFPSPIVAIEKHDAQLQDVVGPDTDIVASGTDVSAPDQQASVSAGTGSANGAGSLTDDDGGLSTTAISALIALVAMSGIAVAAIAQRHTRVRV